MSKASKKSIVALPKDAKKPDEKPKVNFEELIIKNLSAPKLSLDRSGYHFTTLNLAEKGLDSLSSMLANYKALVTVDLHGNNIQDISALANLPNLISLDVSVNNIKDLKALQNEEGFRSLKVLNISKNRINDLITLKCPNLTHLNLSDNLIDKMESFEGHESLRVLELRNNRISTTQQFVNMPKLSELYLVSNRIKTIVGMDSLVSLTKLNLRQNMIEVFEENFPNLESLQYLNLRENKLEKFEEFDKLKPLPNLKTFVFSFNPVVAKNPNYLYMTLNTLLKLQRVNKTEISKSIRLNAIKFAEQAFTVQEEERKRKEEEERLKEQQEQPEEN